MPLNASCLFLASSAHPRPAAIAAARAGVARGVVARSVRGGAGTRLADPVVVPVAPDQRAAQPFVPVVAVVVGAVLRALRVGPGRLFLPALALLGLGGVLFLLQLGPRLRFGVLVLAVRL